MNQRGNAFVYVIIVVVLSIILLVAPFPDYNPPKCADRSDLMCSFHGIFLGSPLYKRGLSAFTNRNSNPNEPTPAPVSEETLADWPIYTNTAYKIKFQHPPGWGVIDSSTSYFGNIYPYLSDFEREVTQKITIIKTTNKFCRLFVFSNPEHLTVEKWIGKLHLGTVAGISLNSAAEDITTSGVAGKRLKVFAVDHTDVAMITPFRDNIYYFVYDDASFKDSPPKDPNCEQIYQTFQFTSF